MAQTQAGLDRLDYDLAMTTQTKKFIELADIIGMRFDCRKCRTSLLLPMEKSPSPPSQCPNCRCDWTAMPDGSDRKEDFKTLADAMIAVSRLHLGCAFTLEIKPEPQEVLLSSTHDPQVRLPSPE